MSKPVRSVSMICGAGFDVRFAETEASVRDPQGGHEICTYPRAGGLYKGDVRHMTPPAPELSAAGTMNHRPVEPLSPSTTRIG